MKGNTGFNVQLTLEEVMHLDTLVSQEIQQLLVYKDDKLVAMPEDEPAIKRLQAIKIKLNMAVKK